MLDILRIFAKYLYCDIESVDTDVVATCFADLRSNAEDINNDTVEKWCQDFI